eukprot:gene1047-230_t
MQPLRVQSRPQLSGIGIYGERERAAEELEAELREKLREADAQLVEARMQTEEAEDNARSAERRMRVAEEERNSSQSVRAIAEARCTTLRQE